MAKLTSVVAKELLAHTSYYKIVQSREEYFNISKSERYSFDVLAVWGLPGFAKALIEDQMDNSKAFKWLHSLSVGCDEYCSVKSFRESAIPCTNARGAFSDVLAEYVLLGILYHAKHVESFQRKREAQNWQIEPVELVSSKTLAVVGYGDIGSSVRQDVQARIRNEGDRSEQVPPVRNEGAGAVGRRGGGSGLVPAGLAESDYVLGSLPKMVSTDNFFNKANTFDHMKKSAIFMNIGRGTTLDEDDLATALHSQRIAGAVLDVFKKEPLAKSNRLWYAPNLFMTPHCAD
eukprot:CAMPEP_0168612910 /NCGR_PEP_ID=MMETSP0449_2-20121227/3168_1 /TAXON_ID=1082188 /ORGANISM="Strombidium rassoulzadegani, Strain ras09" /LENGTH=288 /DNA_ID=CAMNT_0008653505 /DNA_START=79 /DNA_END=945 /DNA_ORIENTATION=+